MVSDFVEERGRLFGLDFGTVQQGQIEQFAIFHSRTVNGDSKEGE